ncbi:MAG TPA: MCE family protein [Candidatus Stackebrandtia faecavium]|nr:MCE family protein [Candidatus Stackebrandtia faecavium]
MRVRRGVQFVALGLSMLLAGCGSAPLPGGEGGDGYTVMIEFADVTDLVEYSSVKVDEVTVGEVSSVAVTNDWTAAVEVQINPEVDLPANAIARLRQTSLLGEKFVDLSAPTEEKPKGTLDDGDTIPLGHTDRGAEVEEVLGALALVLQGGGLSQLRTINTELVDVMEGREGEIKDTLSELDEFMSSLDEQKEEIVIALEALDDLSVKLADQKDTIGDAIDAIAPGVTTLAEQEDLITDAIVALGELGDTGSEVIEQSGDETIAMLQDLQPILENLVAAGDDFPQALELGASYPFPSNITDAIDDDFVNLHITLDASLEDILGNLLGPTPIEDDRQGNEPDEPGQEPGSGIDPITGGLEDLLGVGIGGGDEEEE